mmetsp:Transcript_37693/g.55542  ORF Transcript_37693/g.55542 Transcript_37693/m.55542 type:complete len:274 (-) Transcript_37693:241-1062(-)
MEPRPHVTEQLPQAPHAPTQSTGLKVVAGPVVETMGQMTAPHPTVSVWSSPTQFAVDESKSTTKSLFWVPVPPHVAEHVDHSDQSPAHARGQLPSLHSKLSTPLFAKLHSAPPFSADVDTVNVRCTAPRPHVSEHVLHSLHAPTQSIGAKVVAGPVVVTSGQLAAPHPTVSVSSSPAQFGVDASKSTAKSLLWVPVPPHDSEHVDHSDQSPAHARGQLPSLHSKLSIPLSAKLQPLPPFIADVDTANVRCIAPRPQVFEHAPHSLHAPTQCTG